MKTNNPIIDFSKLSYKDKNISFLHSGNGGKSYLAKNPIEKFNGEINDLEKFINKNSNNLIIGYISYDATNDHYGIIGRKEDDLNLPNVSFFAYDKWEEYETNEEIEIPIINGIKGKKEKNFSPRITKKVYNDAYKKIKKYIKDGDIYQINLTHRLEGYTEQNPRNLFIKTIKHNRVDYLAYIENDGFEILSASPERFIKIDQKQIQTCPIKGTRPRAENKETDENNKKELIEDEKESAELNMITDLLRNDLGKIAKRGTVKLEAHRLIKKCEKVWHTYSKITAELEKKEDKVKALISMLPGGSITGCPKKRAIEIIDELEIRNRGIYTGVIGYIHPNGTLDFNIAIRTIIKKGNNVYLQVGGGIVDDSKMNNEYQETLDKAKSFMNIIEDDNTDK